MFDKLDAIKARFDDLGVALTNPEIIADNRKFGDLSKEYRSLEKLVTSRADYKKLLDDVDFYKEALNSTDEEMRELAKAELPETELLLPLRRQATDRSVLPPLTPNDLTPQSQIS